MTKSVNREARRVGSEFDRESARSGRCSSKSGIEVWLGRILMPGDLMKPAFCGVIAWLATMGAASAAPHLIYIGTYKTNTWVTGAPIGRGVYVSYLDPNDGTLSPPVLAAETPDPAFLAFDPGRRHLYSADGHEASVSAFAIDSDGRLALINRQLTGGSLVPYLAVDLSGRMVIVPDYGSGSARFCVVTRQPLAGLRKSKRRQCRRFPPRFHRRETRAGRPPDFGSQSRMRVIL
jgi:hypothetical protein